MNKPLTPIFQSGAGHSNRQRIGTVTLDGDHVFTTSEQTACNYDRILVKHGTECVIETNGYWTYVAFPGSLVESHWVNRLGASSSQVDTSGDLGREQTYHRQGYAYADAETIATGHRLGGIDGEVRLDEGVVVTASVREVPTTWPGAERKTKLHTFWAFAREAA